MASDSCGPVEGQTRGARKSGGGATRSHPRTGPPQTPVAQAQARCRPRPDAQARGPRPEAQDPG